MAGIASNIFKQLIYVPEGNTIGTVLTDTATTNFSSTNVSNIAVQAAAIVGDDEISVTSVAESGKFWYKGTKVVFSNDTTVYYLTADVALTSSGTKTLYLDRALAKSLTTSEKAVFDFTSESVVPKKLRRVSSNLELKKESYSSNEVNSHQQQIDYRIGAQTIDGTLSCELSSYTYRDFIGAALRKEFYAPVEFTLGQVATLAVATAGTVIGTGIVAANVAVITPSQSPDDRGVAVAASEDSGAVATHKFYGIKVGDIITISNVGATTATINGGAIASIPLLVLDKNTTTQALTVIAANSAESCTFVSGNIALSTKFQVLGKKSFIPLTNHTKKSFQFEQYFSDISRDRTDSVNEPYSELFKGVRIGQASIKLPTSGLATLDLTLMGTGMDTPTTATLKWDGSTSTVGAWDKTKSMMEVLSGDVPLEPAIDAVYSSAVGNLYIKDKKGASGKIYKVGLITSLDFSVNGNVQTLKVIGSTTSPDVTLGKLAVQGSASVYFQDNVFRDIFLNSEDATLIATFTESSSNTVNSAFMNFVFPRIKTGGATKDDAQSIVMSVPFTALLADSSQGYEATTLQIQDYSQLA